MSLALFKEDIALRLYRWDLGNNFLNWYLTRRSFHYSLYARCILSWGPGRALGLFGGLSTGQLNCCLPRMEEKRERETEETFANQTPVFIILSHVRVMPLLPLG